MKVLTLMRSPWPRFPVPLIDPHHLLSLLGTIGDRYSIEALSECESTNTVLLERARNDSARAAVAKSALLVADRQSAGRGRLGRRWLSSPEGSLTFSVLWHFAGDAARLSGLPLAVGLAVARALAVCGARGVGLKWPNDILLGGGKVGGILLEAEAAPTGMLAVLGIGLNLRMPVGKAEEFLYPPAALAQVNEPVPERHRILAQVLIELVNVLDCFAATGFAPLRTDWQDRHAWQGRHVRLLNDGLADRQGICLGADADGALLLQTAAGIERCFSGDLSLRAA